MIINIIVIQGMVGPASVVTKPSMFNSLHDY